MNRRILLAALVILALLGARLSLNRNVRAAFALRPNAPPASLPVTPEPAAAPTAAALPNPPTELPSHGISSVAEPLAPPQIPGVSDYDPHKTFGSKNAPIVMEVFSDFQCPACKVLFTTTNHQLMDNYVTVGKVFLIHRDFPLPMHAYSRVAARYARAAAQLGKSEAVEQALFENQEKWEQTGDVDGTVAAVLSAPEMAKVRALVKGGTLDSAIDKDYSLGQVYHVSSTPTTIIHSKGQTYPVIGVVPYDTMKSFLDQLIDQK